VARPIDIAGQRFGRLVAIDCVRIQRARLSDGKSGGTKSRWGCRCDCGNEATVSLSSLRNGTTKSCGCLQPEVTAARSFKHGHSPDGHFSATYNSWRAMIERCSNPKNKVYAYYGGQGVAVSERWKVFTNFLSDMGERPSGHTLDRYPNKSGNYGPGNCRWATFKEQANNRRAHGTALLA